MLVVGIEIKKFSVFVDPVIRVAVFYIRIGDPQLCKRSIFLREIPVFYLEENFSCLLVLLIINKFGSLGQKFFGIKIFILLNLLAATAAGYTKKGEAQNNA